MVTGAHIFAFGLPTFEFSAILSMLIVTLVIMTETTADIIAVGEIVGAFHCSHSCSCLGRSRFGAVWNSAASGIRTLVRIDYSEQKNLIIVATSIAAGMIPIIDHSFYADFPKWVQTLFHSGMSPTCLMAIVLNIVFNHLFRLNCNKSVKANAVTQSHH